METTAIKTLNIQHLVFEVVPLERLGIQDPVNDIESIAHALQQIGCEPLSKFNVKNALWFFIRDRKYFDELVRSMLHQNESELIWLLTEFFEYIVLLPTPYDLLFALASTKDPNDVGPYSRTVAYISTEVGNPIDSPSLARILCATALQKQGNAELGARIDCTSSFPTETALVGDISFLPTFAELHKTWHLVDEEEGAETTLRVLSILSSHKLVSQDITELLVNEPLLDQIEIARVFPFQLGQFSFNTDNFSLFNHFRVNARPGTQTEVLKELVNISLHLNWSYAAPLTKKLSKKSALSFGYAQLKRLKNLEAKEKILRYSLSLLQKRYPERQDLLQWEVNNLYSNIVRYSSVYLAWRSRLMAFIQGDPSMDNQFTLLVRQIDWSALEKLNIVTVNEGETIVNLLQTDPGSLLTKIRVIIEQCVSYLYQQKYFHVPTTTLHNVIQRLDRDNVFPPLISIYMTTLRTAGNVGAHTGSGSKEDVEALLPLLVRVLEWFLDEGVRQI